MTFDTSNTERMRIESGGNVGIGTTSPDVALDVNDSSGIKVQEEGDVVFEARPGDGYFSLGDAAAVGGGAYITGDNTNIDFFGDGDVRFQNDGNVGIGTTSPSQKLEVAGNIQATGTRSISTLYDSNHYMRLEANSSGGILKGTDGGSATVLFRSYGDSYVTNDFGLGVTSPDEKLHVVGNTRITSRLYNTQHTSPSLSTGQWYRIIEITGASGRGKCEFSIGGSGGSGTPSLVKATVNTAWSNANSTIKVDFNSKSSAFSEFRVVRNATSNKSFVDVKVSGGEDNVLLQVYPIAWDSAYAVDFTNVTTLPSGDSVETSVPLTNTAFALANNNGSEGEFVFKVDHDSKVYAEELFISQRAIVDGGIRIANDNSIASASNVGTLRYRTSGNNSYVDMSMQTGASTYAWVNIVQNTW